MWEKINYPKRKNIRLLEYDYSQAGLYFVTLCTHQRQCLFGDVTNGQMCPNNFGKIVAEEWLQTALIRQNVVLHESVLMPNHFHGIVEILHDNVERLGAIENECRDIKTGACNAPLLAKIVRGYKSAVTRRINQMVYAPMIVWQRNYYEHIIRDEQACQKIAQYTQNNPQSWQEDSLYKP